MVFIWLFLVIAAIIFITAVWKIHPLPVLLAGAFFFGITGNRAGALETIGLISSGFGDTVRNIGLVIIAGTVIGSFMEKRGALMVIARKVLRLTGEKHASLAMSIIGFVVSICIFCDSAFIILIGLWRKIGTLAKLPLAVGAAALSMGLFASHCFIPPTPGPLAALSVLGADFSLVLLFGSLAAIAATAAGFIYVSRAGKYEKLDCRMDSENELDKDDFHLPGMIAFVPVILPLLLICGASLANICREYLPETLYRMAIIAGNPVAALSLGALIAVFGLGKCRKDELTVEGLLGKSIIDAANILIITAGGGAFGAVLSKVDFRKLMPEEVNLPGALAILLPLSFAAVMKIAQGSSTLAILTAAGITRPLLEVLGLTSPELRALTCCAICCGGMIVSHTNDSYFWVVTRFSGMSVRQGLKLQTLGTLVSGVAAALLLLILALLVG